MNLVIYLFGANLKYDRNGICGFSYLKYHERASK